MKSAIRGGNPALVFEHKPLYPLEGEVPRTITWRPGQGPGTAQMEPDHDNLLLPDGAQSL